jgi:Xaa-Pro aminopeptidase
MAGDGSIPFQKHFPPSEFAGRHSKIFDAIGPDAVAVAQGASMATGYSMPRQFSEFYYMCGVESPHAYLLLDGRSRRAHLYLPPRDKRIENYEGRYLSSDDLDAARELTGIESIESTAAMGDGWLTNLPDGLPKQVYVQFTPSLKNTECRPELQAAQRTVAADYWDGRITRESHFLGLLRARFPRCEYQDLTSILDKMRSVKSPREVDVIREASRIAGLAQIEAMRATRPGLYEFHLDAVCRYVFLANGCRLEAYRSIVASGAENIHNAHYYRNESQLRDGDLVLLDYAPELGCYASDVTRMWPVGGKFTPWQRELLQFVLDYRNAIMARIRPGVTARQIMDEVKPEMEPLLAADRFSKQIYRAGARKLVETGGGVFSHPVGLAVHDDGRYIDGPLQPGHVFSIDPQLWVPEESLYIRYEDTIAITEDGMENFTDFVPTELDDIERTVSVGGMLQSFPPVPATGSDPFEGFGHGTS